MSACHDALMSLKPKNIEFFHSMTIPVKTEAGCLEWRGRLLENGYGVLNVNRVYILAHRVSYLIANGAIDPFLQTRHSCDNRRCVNPDHLSLGTCQDNANDRVSRNRQCKGESHGRCRLKTEDVIAIRRHRDVDGLGYKEIAKKFSISRSMALLICHRKKWTHVA